MHPQGTFAAVVEGHGICKAKTGTIQVAVKLKTEHGFITAFLPLTDKSAKNTMKALRAMGFPGDDVSALNEDPPLCAGNEVEIVVESQTYNGQTNPKVAWINAPGSRRGSEIKRDDTAAILAKKFNAMLKREEGAVGKDGIPF